MGNKKKKREKPTGANLTVHINQEYLEKIFICSEYHEKTSDRFAVDLFFSAIDVVYDEIKSGKPGGRYVS